MDWENIYIVLQIYSYVEINWRCELGWMDVTHGRVAGLSVGFSGPLGTILCTATLLLIDISLM